MKTKINNFFKHIWKFIRTIGRFIAKYIKIAFEYIKENVWIQPLVIVALIFGLVFGIQGAITGTKKLIEWIKTGNVSEDKYTTISMQELQGKLDAKEDFVFYIGYEECSACHTYNVVVNKYIKSTGTKFYYLDVGRKDGVYIDYTLEQRNIDEILEALGEISHRDELENLEGLSTPTTIVVRNGIFVDAKIGAIGLQDASDYLDYVEFIEGNQVR